MDALFRLCSKPLADLLLGILLLNWYAMIIEIALGIVLGFVLLAYLRQLLAIGVIAIIGFIMLAIVVAVVAFTAKNIDAILRVLIGLVFFAFFLLGCAIPLAALGWVLHRTGTLDPSKLPAWPRNGSLGKRLEWFGDCVQSGVRMGLVWLVVSVITVMVFMSHGADLTTGCAVSGAIGLVAMFLCGRLLSRRLS